MNLQPTISLGEGMSERAVRIQSGNQSLAGNLIAGDAHGERGVLFIHGFGGVRSGPHSVLTHFARALAQAGIPSIRYDLSGRGESSGDPQDVSLAGMAEDALSAYRLLKTETGISKLTVVGICSGGNVGIGILDRLPECDSLFLMSVYPFGDADSFRRDARRSAAMFKEYWRKLWIRDTWMKLIRGDIQFGIIARTLLKPFARLKAKKTESSKTESKESETKHPLDNVLTTSPHLVMVYGDADPEYGLSTEYYNAFSKEKTFPIDIRTISGANHNFYSVPWKQELTDMLLTFIKEKL